MNDMTQRSLFSIAVLVYVLALTALSGRPVAAGETEERTLCTTHPLPSFTSVSSVNYFVLTRLPQGRLRDRPDAGADGEPQSGTLPPLSNCAFELSTHVVEGPNSLTAEPSASFRALYSLFSDARLPKTTVQLGTNNPGAFLTPLFNLIPEPDGLSLRDQLDRIPQLAEACDSGTNLASLDLYCLMTAPRLQLRQIALTLEDGRHATLVFRLRNVEFDCVRGNDTAECKNVEIPAVLVHDTASLAVFETLPSGGTRPIRQALEIDPEIDRMDLFRVTDLMSPEVILTGLLPLSQPEAAAEGAEGTASAPLLAIVPFADPNGRGVLNATADTAWLPVTSDDILVRYPEALHGPTQLILVENRALRGASGFLAVDLPGSDVAARLAEAFFPAREPAAIRLVAVPNWLFGRLGDRALDSRHDERYCTAPGSEDAVFEAPLFPTPEHPFVALPKTETEHNRTLRALYSEICADVVAVDVHPIPARLPARLASRLVPDLCGAEASNAKEVPRVGGNFVLPNRIVVTTGSTDHSFVLADPDEGIFLQQRPISLSAWSEYLRSRSGCRAATNWTDRGANASRDPASNELLQCPDSLGLTLAPALPSEESDAQDLRALLLYFADAFQRVMEGQAALQVGPDRHNCANATRPELCALRVFFAARAVDRALSHPDGVWLDPDTPGTASDAPPDEADLSALGGGMCDIPESALLADSVADLCRTSSTYLSAAMGGDVPGNWGVVPVALVHRGDALMYADWLQNRQDEEGQTPHCNGRIGLADDAVLRGVTLDAGHLADQFSRSGLDALLTSPNIVTAEFLAANALVENPVTITGRAQRPRIANLPAGYREFVRNPEQPTWWAEPGMPRTDTLASGFGLRPLALLRARKDLETIGFCVSCEGLEDPFAWQLGSDYRPPGASGAAGCASAEPDTSCDLPDPATTFRLQLSIKSASE